MIFLRLLPVFLSILLLAAHFLYAGYSILVFIVLASLLILLIRKPWAALIIQIELVLGGIEWIRALIEYTLKRQARGDPWVRLAVILGTVALITFISALVFMSRSLKERYGIVGKPAEHL